MTAKYSPREVSDQMRYLQNAHNVTPEERAQVAAMLEQGTRDVGIFSWVKCPVWRYRLNEVVRMGLVKEEALNSVFRYVLEGDRRALIEAVPCPR